MKLTRLQRLLFGVLLLGASVFALDRCAGDTTPGQAAHLDGGTASGTGSGGGAGGGGSGTPPGWDSTWVPLTPEQVDSLYRALGEPDSVRENVVEIYRGSWQKKQNRPETTPGLLDEREGDGAGSRGGSGPTRADSLR